MKTTIEWDANHKGVHIKTNTGISLIVSAQPSMAMNWYDAVRFYKDNKVWKLPTREQLILIAKHIRDVNALIMANGGYQITRCLWTADEDNKYYAWYINMTVCFATTSDKMLDYYVRPVSVYPK